MPRRFIPKAVKAKAIADWKAKRKTAQQLRAELRVTERLLAQWGIHAEENPNPMDETQQNPPPATDTSALAHVGSDGRRRMQQHVKDAAVAEYRKGQRSAKEIGAELGVSDAAIYAWNKQQTLREKRQGHGGGSALTQIMPTVAGIDAGRMMLKKALDRMHKIQCPHCGETFQANAPGMTETLVTMAAHLMAGEEP